MQDFKDELVAFSKVAVTRAERVTSEEAAKQYLILPFFQLLGYDPLDPNEIIPEAQAGGDVRLSLTPLNPFSKMQLSPSGRRFLDYSSFP